MTKKTDLYAGYFGFAFILLMLTITTGRLLFMGELTSPIGLLMSNVNSIHIPLENLNPGQTNIFLFSFALKTISAVIICVSLILAMRHFLSNQFFTTRNVKLFKTASWAALAYIFGQFFEGIGNNWVSATEGIDHNVLPNGIDDPGFIPMYILMMVLSMTAIAFTRAVKMQEDQEGLV